MAPRTSPVFSSILRQLRAQPQRASSLRAPLAPRTRLQRPFIANTIAARAAHSIPRPPASTVSQSSEPKSRKSFHTGEADADVDAPKGEGSRPEAKPEYYQLSFTCVPCGYRSHHNVSKQGYHHGSTLITCPECRNRHVISDHLDIFGDRKVTIEDIMREKGQLVKRGSLGEDGDIEFWPDEKYAEEAKKSDPNESS
ncbi:DNL zinc finger-domain-containing protein [Dactylonectria estremocensis]|uniref:DNL zinc finger-domain-containing protein n=1 Tax=Dactylonectria estremocensis TaxID=1079267 RepID=A0A9P9FJY0_9HYPO|nr:DNL zinc finger-domain-containing protein [Dactylonectria estremocensis]